MSLTSCQISSSNCPLISFPGIRRKRGDETEKGDVYTEKEAEKERGDESKKFHKTILPPSKRQAICQQRLWHSLITVIESWSKISHSQGGMQNWTRTSIFGIYIPIWISLAGVAEDDSIHPSETKLAFIVPSGLARIWLC
ncbi:hypothetical protein CFP56_027329 [Quercus suber]|uniref:Uncharacterized protein n=1 Tax=Quercus suber TaxID=58331 RepID=A0AAW0LW15_QUESU